VTLEALRQGRGSVAWIEGEPGIGKSSLVAEAMAASDPGWDVGWGMADQLSERLPLRVMLECLQVRSSSPGLTELIVLACPIPQAWPPWKPPPWPPSKPPPWCSKMCWS